MRGKKNTNYRFWQRGFWWKKVGQPLAKRNWDAARNTRYWSKLISSAMGFLFNDEIKQDVEILRARARDAAKNDPYVVRYLDVIKEKVIGPDGITLYSGVRNLDESPDKIANKVIENHWCRFSKEVTVDGLNLRQSCGLFLETMARDGEQFAIIQRGSEFGPYRIQVKFLDAEFLDLNYNEQLPNGNFIVQGIEFDQNDKPVAYHFFKQLPRTRVLGAYQSNQYERVPAEDVIHGYERERCIQARGIPWYAASLETLHQINEYKATELFASRIAAAKQVFFKQSKGSEAPGDVLDDTSNVMRDGPGDIPILPPGLDVAEWNPEHPHNNYGAFIKTNLRSFAANVGLSYNTIANDAESTSYSSLRQHSIDERGTYRELQSYLKEQLLDRLFAEWLRQALDNKLLVSGNITLSQNFDKYNAPQWRFPVWAWLDPAKETAAVAMQLDYKIMSRTEAARQRGREYKEVIDEIAAENEYAAARGVALSESELNAEFARKIVESAYFEGEKAA